MKKKIITIMLVLSLSFALFAQDSWWENKEIYKITYDGLVNAKPSSVDSIFKDFVGKKFTNELFDSLQAELYSTNEFAYILNDAVKGGSNKDKLILHFSFNELPYVDKVIINGNKDVRVSDIEKAVNITSGDFLIDGQLNATKPLVLALFLDKGYLDASVEYLTDLNTETNKVTVTINIDAKRQLRIGEIDFTGNTVFTARTLRKECESSSKSLFNSGYFVQSAIEKDELNIIQYYKNHGYINAEITGMEKVLIESKKDYDLYKIIYNIKENQRWFIGKITFTGNKVETDQDLMKNQSIAENDVANIGAIAKEIQRISLLYANKGYISVGIDVKQELLKDQEQKDGSLANILNLNINIVEGKRSVVKDIVINGLKKTKKYVLEREVAFKIGDYITANGLINTNNNFLNTGIVSAVKYDLKPIENTDGVVVIFDVTENSQIDLKFGATFGGKQDSFPISGLIQFGDKNLAGTGRDLSVGSQLGPDTQNINISFNDDWVKNIRWQNGFNFGFEHSYKENELQKGNNSDPQVFNKYKNWYPKPYNSYNQWVSAGKPGVDKSLSSGYLMSYHLYTLSLSYSTGYTWLFDQGRLSLGGNLSFKLRRATYDKAFTPLNGLIDAYGQGFKFANSLAFNLLWDGRGVINDPSNGYYIQEQLTYAGGFLFGLSNYIRSTTTLAGYLKVFEVKREDAMSIKGILSLTTTLDLVFNQYFKQNFGANKGKWGNGIDALTSEMPYIDGMSIARGHNDMGEDKKNLEFVLDNLLDFSVPVYQRMIWVSAFASATAAQNKMSDIKNSGLNWFFALGTGVRLNLPGFPIAFYFVKDAQIVNNKFSWLSGPIFPYKSNKNSGLRFVVAITANLY